MVYGRGLSEEFIGRALKDLNISRDDIVIATKIPGDFLNPDDIFRAIDRSLKRLGVDSIDLLQLHMPPIWHNYPTGAYARALERLVALGKVGYIGVSNYPLALVEELRSYLSFTDIVSMQYRFNLVERWAEVELIPYAEANDLTFIPWSPLARGLLTGKYSPEAPPEFKDVRAGEAVFQPVNMARLKELINTLKKLLKSTVRPRLRWR